MTDEHEGDRLFAQLLGRDLQTATLRLAVYGIVISAVASTILAIIV